MKKVILSSIIMPLLALSPVYPQAQTGDVIITEIMADPNPAVNLPAEEFVEILNRSGTEINLEKWKFETCTFPAVTIKPDEALILCSQSDTALFKSFGRVVGLKSFPALTDGGKILCLTDNRGWLIHGVEYSPGWYGNTLKDGGGWSLEMTDTDYPFFGEGNWKASVSAAGGTPGKPNSVTAHNPDNTFEGIENVFPSDSLHILVAFSEPVLDSGGLPGNTTIGELGIGSVTPSDPLHRIFIFNLDSELESGTSYKIIIPGQTSDFAGNKARRTGFEFGLPVRAAEGDILFNEILFNPQPNDPDYIELYNCSEKIFDAARLQLASVNDDGDTSRLYPVSEINRCILPGSYFAVTTGKKVVLERYAHADADAVFETDYLPSMPDEKGHLILFNMELEKIDELFYDEGMHYPLLAGKDGISLEKIHPGMVSVSFASWHSAAGSAGWGTPGAPNSVFVDSPDLTDNISLSSTRISPDGDGFEDFLTIHLSLAGNANVVSATAFDESGNFIKKIAVNLLAGPDSSLLWDGMADDGSPVRTGIYVILISFYDESGNRGQWKKVCSVIR